MLQRAASNAYSWWWASHIRTKQSKWLDQNLEDMEDKVKYTLKLIEEDGDSFAKRAEMYYRKRPELISFVEEFYRAYRALAERYEHMSGELQNANHTIATVFPEQVQYAMGDEEEEDRSSKASKLPKGAMEVPKENIPKVPMKKDTKSLTALLVKKVQPKKTTTTTSSSSATSSGMNKPEAIEEIDKLQKGVLSLQTEKEFMKGSYESGLAKYWEIENRITEMQAKVFSLQDEFSIGTVIEDEEARNLMAATALKSCDETLVQLQEKQDRLAEEARTEYQRIKDAHKKLETLKDEFLLNKTDQIQLPDQDESMKLKNLDQEVGEIKEEKHELELLREKVMEQFELGSSTSLTVTEIAERIDELVNKVIALENAVSSQIALIKRLRSETDELHAHIRSLEDGKETTPIEGSNTMTNKLRELEEELDGVRDLNQSVEDHNDNLQTHFTEARCDHDHLSQKLQSVKLDEDVESTGSLQEEVGILDVQLQTEFEKQQDIVSPTDDGSVIQRDMKTEVEKDKDEVQDPSLTDKEQQEDPIQSKVSDNNLDDEQATEQEYEPNWQQLFLNGIEGRENIQLKEYTSILQNYKDMKKFSEMEKKNRDIVFETNLQLRELRCDNAMKDEEIRSLREKLYILEKNFEENMATSLTESKRIPPNRIVKQSSFQFDIFPSIDLEPQPIFGFSGCQNFESTTERIDPPSTVPETTEIPPPTEEEEIKVIFVDESRNVSTTEEKFRMDIDALLEENLDFWLRFSTSFHQIQKFRTAIQDLQGELSILKENKKQDGNINCTDESSKSDTKPIYKHLREIQTELTVWLEQNALLKDELQYRFLSLCNIQEEIDRVSKACSGDQEAEFTSYQAAKFQGEVLNMKQENNKVADELQTGLDHVMGLQVELETTLSKLNEDLGLSGSKNNHFNFHMKNSTGRPRILLRSFIFGVKTKKQNQKPSIFSCMNPALQKQYSDLRAGVPM